MRKICSIVLVLSMIVTTLLQGKTILASEQEERFNYMGDGFEISFIVDNKWKGGFEATIDIKNTESSDVENWQLCFEMSGVIQNIWNAQILSRDEDLYTIKNVGWNQDIKKGDSVSFSFISDTDFTESPEEYFLQSKMVLADTKSYVIEYTVTNDWQEGFNGDIAIKNIDDKCIEDWQLEFDFDNAINDVWNAELMQYKDNHYILGNMDYNQNIQPGSEIHVGFTCQAGGSRIEPSHFKLMESDNSSLVVKDEQNGEQDTEDENVFEIEAEDAADYVYIDFQDGNSCDSVIDDVTFVNAAEDRMAVRWESSNQDVISQTGEVHRQKESEKVQITAHILIDGKKLEKTFELVVAKKLDIDLSGLTDYSLEELKKLNQENENYYCEVNDFGYLQTLYGNFSTVKVDSYEAALYSLYHLKSALGITNPFTELQVYDCYTSEEGCTYHFKQMYEGIPVFSNEITVYVDKNGKTSYIRSSYHPFLEEVNTAFAHSYEEIKLQFEQKHPACKVSDETGELMLINYYGHIDLVWGFSAYFSEEDGNIKRGENQFLVGASDYGIKYHINLSEEGMGARTIAGHGYDLSGKHRQFSVTRVNQKKFNLENRKKKIKIYNGKAKFNPFSQFGLNDKYYIYSKKENRWGKSCVSAMYNTEKIYGFIFESFRKFSYNCASSMGAGKGINVYINTAMSDNLMWYSSKNCIVVGTGTGKSNTNWQAKTDNQLKAKKNGKEQEDSEYHFSKGSLAIADDLMCHEFTHALFNRKNKQRVSDESSYGVYGIIKEAYADILSCCYDKNWTMGEKAAQDKNYPLRAIKNPAKTKCASKIGADDRFYVDYTDYLNDHGGVHTNSTIISHIFSELYNKSNMSWPELKKIWMFSVKQIGYDDKTDFWDVALNLRTSLENLGLQNHMKDLNEAIKNAGISTEEQNKHYSNYDKRREEQFYCDSYFCKQVCLNGKVIAANGNKEVKLENVKLSAMNDTHEQSALSKTDTNGMYQIEAAICDKYCISFKKEGYLDEVMYVTDINELLQTQYYCDTVELISQKDGGMGSAYGKIVDAKNAGGVFGLKLRVRKGINNIYTEPLCELLTDTSGKYRLENVEAGNYCMEIVPSSQSSFASTYINVKVLGNHEIGNQNGVVSEKMDDGKVRVVLTWKEAPRDLDAHVKCNIGTQSGHLYYSHKSYYCNETLIGELDTDNTHGYGPETVTFRDDITGSFRYYVYNYSADTGLGGCGAVVKVYLSNKETPSYIFHVPCGEGAYWDVFTYNSATKRLQITNQIVSNINK